MNLRLITIFQYTPHQINNFLNSFQDRLIFQKTIYLLQKMHLKGLEYPFSYYLNGPYSSDLANDGFLIYQEDSHLNGELLDQEDINIIHHFSEIIGEDKDNPLFYELLSSLIYQKGDKNISEVLKEIFNNKPYLNDLELIKKVLTKAKSLGVL